MKHRYLLAGLRRCALGQLARAGIVLTLCSLLLTASSQAQTSGQEAATQAEPGEEAEQAEQVESTDEAEQTEPTDQADQAEQPPLPYTELPIGTTITDTTTDANWSNFTFVADAPGVLTVVARRTSPNLDLSMRLLDAQGNQLVECDIDFAGDAGAEHFTAMIPAAGQYRVSVFPLGIGGEFRIGGSWIAYEGAASAAPAKPSDAIQLTPGQAQTCTINGSNPPNAWLKYTADVSGLIVLNISAGDRADLYLEQFDEQAGFQEPVQYADNDLRGDFSREKIVAEVAAGQSVYFRINAHDPGPAVQVQVRATVYVEKPEDE